MITIEGTGLTTTTKASTNLNFKINVKQLVARILDGFNLTIDLSSTNINKLFKDNLFSIMQGNDGT